MKISLFILFAMGTASAFAQSATSVCMDLSFRSDRNECMRIIDRNHLDRKAARVCASMSFGSSTNDCLRASINKEYLGREINYCENQTFRSDIIECMESTGDYIRDRRVRRSDRRSRNRSRNKIEIATRSSSTPVVTEVRYDHNEYVACYERPKTRLVTYTDQRQARRGNKKVVGGLIGVLGGQLVGAVTGNDKVGDAISIAGAAVAVYGAVEVADASEIIYADNGYDCRSYYQVDRRVYKHRVQRQRCETRRYYSNRWGSEHEYFETTCSGRRYMSFERNTEIWYN